MLCITRLNNLGRNGHQSGHSKCSKTYPKVCTLMLETRNPGT